MNRHLRSITSRLVMLHWLLGTRLEVPTKLIPIDVLLGVLALVAFLPVRREPRRQYLHRVLRRGIVTVAAGTVGYVACWIVGDVLDLFGVDLTDVTRMWVAIAFAGVALGVWAVFSYGVARRLLAVALVPLALLASALGINVDFAAYPTMNALLQTDPVPALVFGSEHANSADKPLQNPTTWSAPADMPGAGLIGTVTIPGTISGFPARPAVVYLPPAARTADPPVLPVILSFSGQPGSPADMFLAGGLQTVADDYARAHHGLAPIIVSVDQLAVPGHNPMCVDSKIGNSATYVLRDVPNWIKSHLNVTTNRAAWGLIGFSQGGTCANQFMEGHPKAFSAALAIASERYPDDRGPQNSANEAFGGSLAKWRAAWPEALMRKHRPYDHHLLILTYGANDPEFADDARSLQRAAEHAGIQTVLKAAPGSAHDWNTVQWSLSHELPTEVEFLFGG